METRQLGKQRFQSKRCSTFFGVGPIPQPTRNPQPLSTLGRHAFGLISPLCFPLPEIPDGHEGAAYQECPQCQYRNSRDDRGYQQTIKGDRSSKAQHGPHEQRDGKSVNDGQWAETKVAMVSTLQEVGDFFVICFCAMLACVDQANGNRTDGEDGGKQ